MLDACRRPLPVSVPETLIVQQHSSLRWKRTIAPVAASSDGAVGPGALVGDQQHALLGLERRVGAVEGAVERRRCPRRRLADVPLLFEVAVGALGERLVALDVPQAGVGDAP